MLALSLSPSEIRSVIHRRVGEFQRLGLSQEAAIEAVATKYGISSAHKVAAIVKHPTQEVPHA
jgi:hypothetical protein